MLGTKAKPNFKGKAAETGALVSWACDFAERWKDVLPNGAILFEAGTALLAWKRLVALAEMDMTRSECEEALEVAVRHCTLMQHCDVDLLPKHHLWIHMCLQMPLCGNPRQYATFLDESLNSVLAAICQSSHRLTWEKSVFERIRLMPYVERNSYFAQL